MSHFLYRIDTDSRLRIIESKLKAIVEKQGHDLAVIQALFRESKQNITTKKVSTFCMCLGE